MLELKSYQERSLEELRSYLKQVSRLGARTAFFDQTNRTYNPVPQLSDVPYVCLRIPTGGGKTLMACHSLGLAAKVYLRMDKTACLWLVPSNTIREQTLTALRNREHPYRQVLDSQFSSQIRVMDLTEALYLQRSTLDGETVVIVSTLAALRVQDTEGRKVYDTNGNLQHHFSGLAPQLLEGLEKTDGTVIYSLANILRLRRPVVIMDEAHNARTPLSFDTLARFKPSCVIEFTATPQTENKPDKDLIASNILHHVSAWELKTESMVKLPIKLRTRPDWKEVIGEAVQMQGSLEKAAQAEKEETGEYIRPIALLQAQAERQAKSTLTVDTLKQVLKDDFRIPEDQIAIATGETREIENVDLSKPDCPIRFIITIQALKEGWDCSFAYILCSVTEVATARSVEQVLGRILRLPKATHKKQQELNFSYAFVASPRFLEVAFHLKDALVENGFQKMEANELVTPQEPAELSLELVSETVSQAPNLSKLDATTSQSVRYDPSTGRLSFVGRISAFQADALKSCFSRDEDKAVVERLARQVQVAGSTAPDGQPPKDKLSVPYLGVRSEGHLELFDESFLDSDWNLAQCDAVLSQSEFDCKEQEGSEAVVDVTQAGKLEISAIRTIHEQLSLLNVESGWTIPALANWLDRQIPHIDITQSQSSLFIHKVLTVLTESRKLPLEEVARHKYRLRDALELKIAQYRAEQRKKTYQAYLTGEFKNRTEANPGLCFTYSKETYDPNHVYNGSVRFQKHYFPDKVGELDSDDEIECAGFLDHDLQEIKYWVRNLSKRPHSFWLQTSTDKFYPDFVCLLNDERILVVEYKSERDWSNDDSKEKRAVGELWAERSKGRCLFAMPKGKDFKAIAALIHHEKPVHSSIVKLQITSWENAKPFKTHVPMYDLKAAAGRYGDGREIQEKGWVALNGRKLDKEMFVAQVIGHSMEPRIPDGSYCLFRANPVGTRQGKIVLAQYRGPEDPDTGGQFTVKRYKSEKVPASDGEWEHSKIVLEPLNPDFKPIEIKSSDADDVKVVAEFLEVL